MMRTFLAVGLDADLRARVARLQRELHRRLDCGRHGPVAPRVSWVAPEALHLTLRFLGDIDAALIEPLREALRPVLTARHRLSLPLERLGVFPDAQQPRVLWLGPSAAWASSDAALPLTALQCELESCCRALGLPPEQQHWHPHVTLARIRQDGPALATALARSGVLHQPVTAGALAIDAITLLQSELLPGGSVYKPLWKTALAAEVRLDASED